MRGIDNDSRADAPFPVTAPQHRLCLLPEPLRRSSIAGRLHAEKGTAWSCDRRNELQGVPKSCFVAFETALPGNVG
jgi:hypothetical protein